MSSPDGKPAQRTSMFSPSRASMFSPPRSIIVRSAGVESRLPLFLLALENQRLWLELDQTRWNGGGEQHLRRALLYAEERAVTGQQTVELLEQRLRCKEDEVLRLTRQLDKENKSAPRPIALVSPPQKVLNRPSVQRSQYRPPIDLLFSHASSRLSRDCSPRVTAQNRGSGLPVFLPKAGITPHRASSPTPFSRNYGGDIELSASKLSERTSSPAAADLVSVRDSGSPIVRMSYLASPTALDSRAQATSLLSR